MVIKMKLSKNNPPNLKAKSDLFSEIWQQLSAKLLRYYLFLSPPQTGSILIKRAVSMKSSHCIRAKSRKNLQNISSMMTDLCEDWRIQ